MTKSEAFWNLYESFLVEHVEKDPDKYPLRFGETATQYAHTVRTRMQERGVAGCNWKEATFARVCRVLCIKHTLTALKQSSAD
jgi:hypothetical protein